MRVIAGKARRLPLKTVDSMDTRPTTDRIKETLFNMLQGDIPGCRFLDLFSGSGGIGIEALSRGAKEAVFVENSKNAVKVIKDNLEFTKLLNDGSCKANVMEMDAASAVNRLNGCEAFDIIFMDPPYKKDLERDVLRALERSTLVDNYTTIIVEEALDTELDYVSEYGFEITKVKTYKTNKHIYLCKISE